MNEMRIETTWLVTMAQKQWSLTSFSHGILLQDGIKAAQTPTPATGMRF